MSEIKSFAVDDIVKGISTQYGVTNTHMTRARVLRIDGSNIELRVMSHTVDVWAIGCTYWVRAEDFEKIGHIKAFVREEFLEQIAKGNLEVLNEYDLHEANLRSANLSGADLRSANLSGANLSGADLRSANLSGANLRSANLSGADLRSANLRSANLSGADLRSANLSGANLRSANLSGADLRSANLSGANLRSANLRSANLSGADLRSANLSGANLSGADLRSANLSGADLRSANLSGADLSGADLRSANLRSANLSGADLRSVYYDECTAFFAIQCPEEGAFIGYKKARGGFIVKLRITETAMRSSATSRKCRCSEAEVLSITTKDGNDAGINCVSSDHDPSFVYEVGKTVKVDNFEKDRWIECAAGIHFFVTRQEAVNYGYF